MNRAKKHAVFEKLLKIDLVPILSILIIIGFLYLRLPRAGDIWWMDAPRHALNGAFVLDFFRQLPLTHPIQFAYDYYKQWPALTILFYPPLFYVVTALFYSIFGVSESSALLVEFVFFFFLTWGAYRLSRYWLDAASSLTVALLLLGAPEVFFWGQQIMLDIPAYAFLVWAAYFHVGYLRCRQRTALYLAILCAAAAVYTKYNAAFFLAVLGLSELSAHEWRHGTNVRLIKGAVLGMILLLPVITLLFTAGRYNLQQAVSVAGTDGTRWSVAALTYYASILPSVLSWPILTLSSIYMIVAGIVPRYRPEKHEATFLILWVVVGYCFYSAIAVKEPRHILMITYPLVLVAVLVIDRSVEWRLVRMGVCLAAACFTLVQSVLDRPIPYVTGMTEAATALARIAPPESNVAFWGRLDGTFVFAMRAYANRPDVGVIRLDKLLFSDLAVAFERGFKERDLDGQQIYDTLRALHSQYVVFQIGYLDNIEAVKRLRDLLASNRFSMVATIPMTANYPYSYITDLQIYRMAEDVPTGRVTPEVEVKLLGKTL